MSIEKVKKRNGSIADFDRDRIQRAIHKAFENDGPGDEDGLSDSITLEVLHALEARFPGAKFPGVEDIQDTVEEKIAERGFFDVAKAYILYRNEHEKQREDERHELLKKISDRQLDVTKRDGSKVPFDLGQIRAAIERYVGSDLKPSVLDQVIQEALSNVYDGISTS